MASSPERAGGSDTELEPGPIGSTDDTIVDLIDSWTAAYSLNNLSISSPPSAVTSPKLVPRNDGPRLEISLSPSPISDSTVHAVHATCNLTPLPCILLALFLYQWMAISPCILEGMLLFVKPGGKRRTQRGIRVGFPHLTHLVTQQTHLSSHYLILASTSLHLPRLLEVCPLHTLSLNAAGIFQR